jgi:hypothetical protein
MRDFDKVLKYELDKKIKHNINELEDILFKYFVAAKTIKTNKRIEYYNFPCAFDIETSSFHLNEQKVAIMYEWTLGLNGFVFIGRTWEEFENACKLLTKFFNTDERKRLVIYVHNLSYEFQFIRKHFQWIKVFSVKQRKPVYALTSGGIEFRCSYLLSGYSLKKLGEQLQTYKIEKLVGDLDYSKIRHSNTPLTEKELNYCYNDVMVVMCYIKEKMNSDGDISKICLTKTGYVRKYCRYNCFFENGRYGKKGGKKFLNYRRMIDTLTITPSEYNQLQRAFGGGFTHANPFYSGKIMYDVDSFDFTSSYPYVMISEQFPMSKAEHINLSTMEEFEFNLETYCCLFDIEIFNLYSKVLFENYISSSHCRELKNAVIDNGRIVSADHLVMTVTECDYIIIREMYQWDDINIFNFCRYKKDYLPTDFVKSIIKLFVDKTQLKGVEGKEVEYLVSKENLNSCYGMMVTDICRDEIVYDDDKDNIVHLNGDIDENGNWSVESPNIDDAIEKYNKSKNRFLYYPWGVWVTAYARFNLFTGILEFGDDYIYSDTDSIKVINLDKHKDYIEWYNNIAIKKVKMAFEHHKLDKELMSPKNIYGETKQLGVWEQETVNGKYLRFKTLGAKRYMIEKKSNKELPIEKYERLDIKKDDKKAYLRYLEDNGNEISITVSGVNKIDAIPYLIDTFGDKIFENFSNNLVIPADYTGKMTHTYIDFHLSGEVTDYLGNTEKFSELSAIHLETASYNLSITKAYVDYIRGIINGTENY